MVADSKDRPALELDNKTEQGFCSFYLALPAKAGNTVRLFERSGGDFYSVHGDDAHYVARNVYKTTTVLKYLGGDASTGLPSCTMSRLVAETFLRDALLTQQLRVEIWVSDSATTAGRKIGLLGGGGGGSGDWKLGRQASPGNLQELEDVLFAHSGMDVAPVVAALQLSTLRDQKVIGVAFADTTQCTLGVTEFVDNDLFSNLESLVIQLGIKECILPVADAHRDYDMQKIRGLLDRCNAVVTEVRRGDFQTKDAEQDLNRLLEEETSVAARPEFEMKQAMGATMCLIKYLALLSDENNFGRYCLIRHDLSQFMKLDASALRALNLMPTTQLGGNQTMSLFGLLDKCKTSQGSRLLRQWLKQPLMNLDEIGERHSLVQQFVEDVELLQSLHNEYLRSVPDLNRLAKKFQRGKAHLQDIVRVYQVVVQLPALITALDGAEVFPELVRAHYITPLETCATELAKLQELVETMIDLAKVDHHQYLIKAEFDPTLAALEAQMTTALQAMAAEQARVGRDLDMELDKRLKLEKSTLFGYCFRLTRIDAACIRNRGATYPELAVQKNGVYFTTPTLRALATEHTDAAEEYGRVQSVLVKEVMAIVASYCPAFERLNTIVAHLDVILSLAHTAVQAPTPYVRPTMRATGGLTLVAARHPCLEVQDDVTFIPNDVRLERGTREFQVITGPNMAGKSTYIRQVGVIVLMAQIGSFVPCDEAEVCLFDSVLARVGAGDNQMKGISTFMAEMLETSSIIKTATDRSLIIIDELGRGTSTHDGFGLAWAISEYILKHLRCFCLFATHFHELTALTEEFPQVGNLHVMAHVGEVDGRREITLLYKVQEGVCDQSFGIHVAELANFPESVVRLAKRKAEELEDFSTEEKAKAAATGDGVQEGANRPAKRFTPEQEAQGQTLIKRFLTEFSRTPGLDGLASSEVRQAVVALKAKYESEFRADAYVQDVLATL
ncbi:MSH2 protein [Tieghemiomyces parasiticus]|uniref:DNA mismatch repair protein MSH2 n=1 Tax=Tieghemiomyces parasiticus TaxID=78921 RepID=A0A9W8DZ14_9FUNG|nr:MSH2 protein [Tieghemiomyces parasiticus]